MRSVSRAVTGRTAQSIEKLVKKVVAEVNAKCKNSAAWLKIKEPAKRGDCSGDGRLAAHTYGDEFDAKRLKMFADVRKVLQNPSPTRDNGADVTINVLAAGSGMGKSHFIDRAATMELESQKFTDFLRIVVTFNGEMSGTLRFPLAARLLLSYFCGAPTTDEETTSFQDALKNVSQELLSFGFKFDELDDQVKLATAVVAAIEENFCAGRRAELSKVRTVLLIDEISKTSLLVRAGCLCVSNALTC
ncbi:MAG: hypothetical protein IPK60_20625 [Sandaracinaceae bacterium]|nr:hypothetical protein [Sandaracinaceae bacterium]